MTGRTIGDVYGNANASMSSIGNYMDQLMGLAEENSARSQAYAREEMDFNSLEAAKNRGWQEYMSNTAHQREVLDLQAAGLNPVLSASGGNGAAVTSGATASGAHGTVDSSATAAMVSLLNNAINADVALEQSKNSALTSLAVSEKQAQSAQMVQMLANDQSFKNAVYNADTNRAIAAMNNAQSDINSQRSYGASIYGSNAAASASRYGAAQAAAASRYSADQHFIGTKYSANSAKTASMFNTFANFVTNKKDRQTDYLKHSEKLEYDYDKLAIDQSYQTGQLQVGTLNAVSNVIGSIFKGLGAGSK